MNNRRGALIEQRARKSFAFDEAKYFQGLQHKAAQYVYENIINILNRYERVEWQLNSDREIEIHPGRQIFSDNHGLPA